MQCSQLRQLSEVRQLNDMKNNSTKRFANFHGVWLYVIADLRQSVHFLLFQFDIYFAAFFANKTKSYMVFKGFKGFKVLKGLKIFLGSF